MWAIKILSGPQAGQVIALQPGQNRLGRGPTCEVKINSNSVSKEHASILMSNGKLILSDLNSRNGTFVNGVKIKSQAINRGDKITLHDILLDVIAMPVTMPTSHTSSLPATTGHFSAPAWAGNAALRLQDAQNAQNTHLMQAHMHDPQMGYQPDLQGIPNAPPPGQQQMKSGSLSDVFYNFKIYIDNVAMPGVYGIVQSMSFRLALAVMVILYVVIVTALSTVPMITTTKRGIQQESVRRAKTIARNLAAVNRQAVIEKNDVALTTRAAELEEGVTAAIIISAKDGTILAPTNKRGEFANKPFVNQARREERETDSFIDDSNLGVAVPISQYNADSGGQAIVAYSIVLYDMGALAMNTSQTLSLFIQTLAMSLIVGAILYFFLFKIVEHPIEVLNSSLDDALRENRDDLKTDYRFPALESLVSNINSALTRIGRGGPDPSSSGHMIINRDIEATNIVRMLPLAAITINAIDERVIATNPKFDQLMGGGVNLQGRSISEVVDPALKANLTDLIPRMRNSISEIALSEIPFSGEKYEICGQAVMGNGEPAYYLVTMHPLEYA